MRRRDPERTEEQKAAILQAAARCFARHGVQAATMAQIAREAGLTAGALYWYFPGKEAIVAAFASLDHAFVEEVAAGIAAAPTGEAALAAYLLAAAARARDPLFCALTAELYAEGGRNPQVASAFGAGLDRLRAALTVRLGDGPAAAVAAELALALGEGLALRFDGTGREDGPLRAPLAKVAATLARLAADPG